MRGTALMATDKRDSTSGRYRRKNRVFIGENGENVGLSHAYVAQTNHLVVLSGRLFLISIITYISAVVVWAFDRYSGHRYALSHALCATVPIAMCTVGLYCALRAIGEPTPPGSMWHPPAAVASRKDPSHKV